MWNFSNNDQVRWNTDFRVVPGSQRYTLQCQAKTKAGLNLSNITNMSLVAMGMFLEASPLFYA